MKKNMKKSIHSVHNLREGSRLGNWIKYWENSVGEKAGICHNILCTSTATDGAHVQLDSASNDKWYIVPLCHSCNCKRGEHISVWGPLVRMTDPSDILE
jgi:hypothetical protein